MSKLSKTITILGVSLLLIYAIIQLLTFYGVTKDVYGIYIMFYLFILLCYFVFPDNKKMI
jgi:hypothetical protein